MNVGLIADTHGWTAPDALDALEGCDVVLHAGDVGEGVLEPLSRVVPVHAVRGNNDTRGEASLLPEVVHLELEGRRVVVVHRLVDAPREPFDILVFGHCHRRHDYRGPAGALYVNPGAAGRRGFHSVRSVALLELTVGREEVSFVELGPRTPRPLLRPVGAR